MSKNEAMIEKKAPEKYSPDEIELRWQRIWEEEGVYQPDMTSAKRPFYNLMMFPYPSAEGLHVGSVFAFSGVDIYGRFKRMQGNDVFEPIGLDGFGIHAENHAIKTGTHPMAHAKRTEENFYRQLHSIGNGFDWRAKTETYDPHYYKWTQWLFTELFKAGLAYRKKSSVNFCPSCKTVLADEQAVERSKIKNQRSKIEKEEIIIEDKVKVCERCDTEIEIRELEQWFFRITKYADRLLANIEKLNWTDKVKIAQRNWIGKSEGALVKFSIFNFSHKGTTFFEGSQFSVKSQFSNFKQNIEVFTTRIDTLFGGTFLVISPELAQKWLSAGWKAPEKVIDYVQNSLKLADIDRGNEDREKTGVFTGVYAINPANQGKMPIWVADFVIGSYGTGAVFADAHDKRDFEFAKKFGIPLKPTLKTGNKEQDEKIMNLETCFTEDGILFDSGQFSGLTSSEARRKIVSWLSEKGDAKLQTNYHLRDWLISRQRYWGPPIPMVYCAACAKKGDSWWTTEEGRKRAKGMGIFNEDWNSAGWYPVEEKDLPVKLPYVEDYKPMGTGKAPLANYPDFYETKCARGHGAKRETDVSDTFLDSAWYFFRYISTEFDDRPFDKLRVKKWLPVNSYIGGAEHSVLHLLYARFVTMVLHDLGHIIFEEPFAKFYAHGLIIKDGAKMSKSRGNVINPDEYISKFGADTLRMYLHFLGPFDKGGDFRDTGIEGMSKFLKRVWTLFKKDQRSKIKDQKLNEEALRMMHGTIAGVTADMEHLHYNTAIAKLMSYYNFLVKQEAVSLEEASVYLRLLAPFAPHMTEELWQEISSLKSPAFVKASAVRQLSKANSIHLQLWPDFDPGLIKEDTVMIPVQVNGKLRDTIKDQRSKIKDQRYLEKKAKDSEKVAKYLEGKKILKVIFVPGKVINFVVKE